ncbi:hypothetical protein [Paenibacillus sp. TC-CSREp1]|uniref:hypothetical protein n=1 Tax=Paenibacillus sp. TC-CSREp1 TaxID=3410089 RepID=UPI003CE928E5
MTMIRRYEFTCTLSVFATTLASTLKNALDPYWETLYTAETTYANWGNVLLTNTKSSYMRFTMCVVAHARGVNIRWGLKNQGGSVALPDLFINPPADIDKFLLETPFMCHNGQYNVNYKWSVITNEDMVFIHGESLNYPERAYPVRIFLGKCEAIEKEDPAIASKFYGVFPHMPFAYSDNNAADQYDTPRGVVMASRNGTEYTLYNFGTESIPSPGVGSRYYVTPFMVYHPLEGARGELKGIRSIVFKNSVQHPDGSILDLGQDGKYYVFHVMDQDYPNADTGRYYYNTNQVPVYGRPKFFHGAKLLGGGQRALLFQI